jgi:hypothetical protein
LAGGGATAAGAGRLRSSTGIFLTSVYICCAWDGAQMSTRR